MRPPSYYNSLSSYQSSSPALPSTSYHGSSSTSYSYRPSASSSLHLLGSSSLSHHIGSSSTSSSNQLRSSISSPSSSSYVTRTHLPYVPQTMLVAHCFTGSQHTKPSQSTSYTPTHLANLRPKSTKQRIGSSSAISSSSSPSSRYLKVPSHSSYTPSSYTPSYTPSSSSYHTTAYSSARSPLSSTSYYKPIRLRERPILNQISRQFTATDERPSVSRQPSGREPSSRQDTAAKVKTEPAEEWASDVARNISRNKYLIKFREIEKPKPPVEQKSEEPQVTAKEEPEVDEMKLKELSGEEPLASETKRRPPPAEPQATELAKVRRSPKERAPKLSKLKTTKQTGDEPTSVKTSRETKEQDQSGKTPPSPSARTGKPRRLNKAASKTKLTGDSPKLDDTSSVDENCAPVTGKSDKSPSAQLTDRSPLANRQLEEAEPKAIEVEDRKTEMVQDEAEKPTTDHQQQQIARRIKFREYHLDDFNFLSVLGHGGWGFVILAELKDHDACFAVKCIKKITIIEDDDIDSIMIERKMLTLGNIHPFICKLFCTFETEGYLFFVMEYCAGGDLMFHVQKEGKFSESRCRFYASEIICAIRFLHNRHIIYRDLKLDNILLDSKGHIRLVDFGMCQCRSYREEMMPSNFCGTPEYISPEIIKGVPYNHSVDWWSFGVLLYEMAVGKMPFRGSDENELLWNVCYEQIHYPMFLTKELTSLLQSLLEREPSKRMGMASCKLGDIQAQPWFRGVDWAKMETMQCEPPFVPEVRSSRDVQNFDSDFTDSKAELSPVDQETLDKIDQRLFQTFPYTNPNMFAFDT